MNWLDEPAAHAAPADVASPESLGFDEEPFSAEPLGELGVPEEAVAAEALPPDAHEGTLPPADAEADALDWLTEPASSAPQVEVESLDDIEFGEEATAAEPIVASDEPGAIAPAW